ncbi:nucleoside/nucleotide kinase family protein [Aeromicrobium sp.]|uniref:nucleoside/nucleotide kinase family protein n=1 Tax=Aeromicrobium sp. TaxID=1871063 RepID=UPI003D6A9F0E
MDQALVARARAMANRPGRALLGIVGAPGAGKSTLASALADGLRAEGLVAVLVPMDGFHLPQAELVERGLRNVMGRIDTFDAEGYLALLRRLRDKPDETVTAPDFDRTVEEPVIDAITVGPEVQLVVTEGNYLLDADDPWPAIRATLDEVWYVGRAEEARLESLVRRHVEFGKTEAEAQEWVQRVDEPNAARIRARRETADLRVR